jgi:hypothetical protein
LRFDTTETYTGTSKTLNAEDAEDAENAAEDAAHGHVVAAKIETPIFRKL